MREYTAKEQKLLQANPYTYEVTKSKLYFTVEFKEAFWTGYKAGIAPRKMLKELGYEPDMFGQKQIDSMVQSIKKRAISGKGFSEGENRSRRPGKQLESIEEIRRNTVESGDNAAILNAMERLLAEVSYLRQEVDFLKKISKSENARKCTGL